MRFSVRRRARKSQGAGCAPPVTSRLAKPAGTRRCSAGFAGGPSGPRPTGLEGAALKRFAGPASSGRGKSLVPITPSGLAVRITGRKTSSRLEGGPTR